DDGIAFEMWLKEVSGSNLAGVRDLTSSGGTYFLFDAGGSLQLRVNGTTVNTTVPTATFAGSTWRHFVVEYVHSTTTVNVYVDGELEWTDTISAVSGTTVDGFRVFRGGTASANALSFAADEVAFYDHPLGSTRV